MRGTRTLTVKRRPLRAGYTEQFGRGLPNPLLGSVVDSNGNVQFGIVEAAATNTDGTVEASVIVSFLAQPRW